ncbi:unnamed protein product [Vitrella brassicaformis CCMP3155]|uniref:WAP domain-containing protein n=2 Tax=Vitrella brassicaformis TaxID=1169539 RepID=A0A0G4EN34_VITBC|nr:unnamed protein product [Vitrella brassicaformis CCMP3155]|eukprot:CEL98240.1 unnamed protein product [Vitrella brassicaformis CCMP3155]
MVTGKAFLLLVLATSAWVLVAQAQQTCTNSEAACKCKTGRLCSGVVEYCTSGTQSCLASSCLLCPEGSDSGDSPAAPPSPTLPRDVPDPRNPACTATGGRCELTSQCCSGECKWSTRGVFTCYPRNTRPAVPIKRPRPPKFIPKPTSGKDILGANKSRR